MSSSERTAEIASLTLGALQAAQENGQLTAAEATAAYLQRIEELDRQGPCLRAVIEVNPEALAIAKERDREREAGQLRGPLHGIPILIKDNIDSADQMMTTAGSLALCGAAPAQDATVVRQLREAGAVLLGKTNLSEWANYRSRYSSSGWSGRGGQSRNPFVLDRNPSGSSSGSAIAMATGFAAVSLGSETDGSIVSPASSCGVVGVKPTVGLLSRAGVVPIAHSQDTVGIHARCVADAAIVLAVLATDTPDPRDPATLEAAGHKTSYHTILAADALRGARIGVARNAGFERSEKTDALMERALEVLRAQGATLVDPAPLPSTAEEGFAAERLVLSYEFKSDLNAYLATRRDVALDREGYPLTLAGVIAFNTAHAAEELSLFGQDLLIASEERGPLSEQAYQEALATSQRLGGVEGIDRVLDEHGLDALIAPTAGPAPLIDPINGSGSLLGTSSWSAQAGYPIVSLPAGLVGPLPVSLSFIGRRFSEARLLALAYAYEQATQHWRAPQFLPTIAVG